MKMSESFPKKRKLAHAVIDYGDDCQIVEDNSVSLIVLDTSLEDEVKGDCQIIENIEDNAPESLFQIKFTTEKYYTELKDPIGSCIKNVLFALQKSINVYEDISSFTITISKTTEQNNFIVDSNPSSDQTNTNIPKYSSSFSNVFNEESNIKTNDDCNPNSRAQQSCFNCDGNHSIKDCTEPKNFVKIKENRSKFAGGITERYHVDADQRFGYFQPGELSSNLRKALGLRGKALPLHIYRMRICGYPPGWLLNAKVSNSGLAMFDSQGKDLQENNDEENDKFDLKKIISFPGFNVKPASGTIDDYRFNRAPPMLPHQSKETMMKELESNKTEPYKQEKLKTHLTINADSTESKYLLELSSAAMDIDDVDEIPIMPLGVPVDTSKPPLPLEIVSPTPPPPPPKLLPDENSKSRSPSPTLDDLNIQKKRLLAALDDSTLSTFDSTSATMAEDSLIDDILALDSSSQTTMLSEDDNDNTVTSTPLHIRNSLKTPNNLLQPSTKSVLGTPVLKSVSPFSILPIGDKWSLGVVDILNFENLPDSTGKHKKMETVIGKVRNAVKKLNNSY